LHKLKLFFTAKQQRFSAALSKYCILKEQIALQQEQQGGN